MKISLPPWLLGVLLWLLIALPAHAQQSPMVQCRIGSWIGVVPDFACSALMKGATKLRPDDKARGIYSINDCDKEVTRYVNAPFGSFALQEVNAECNAIFSAMLYDNATRGPVVCDCPECRPTMDCVGGKPRR